MKKIIAFAASNSKTSINKKLATYASSLVNDVEVSVLDLNDYQLAMYSVDEENESGIPENAHAFLDKIKQTDGIILSIAEHNGTYTTAFKNLFDWMSRIDNKLWSNKPMLLMSTSPGARAGATAFEIAYNRFKYMGGNIVAQFSLPSFNDNFSEGSITNKALNDSLLEEISNFKQNL